MKTTRLANDKRAVARVLADVQIAINLLNQWADRTHPEDAEAKELNERSRASAQALQRDMEPEP